MGKKYSEYIRIAVTVFLLIHLVVGVSAPVINGSVVMLSFYVMSIVGMVIMQAIMLGYGLINTANEDSKKWLYISCFIPIIGAILYWGIGRNKNEFGGIHNE